VVDEGKTRPKAIPPLRVVLRSGVSIEVVSADQLPLAAGLIQCFFRSAVMLTLSGSLRVFLALEPCDMRKSFDSLHALVVGQLGEDPRGGAVFVSGNRSTTVTTK
jgi:hypothetical protein